MLGCEQRLWVPRGPVLGSQGHRQSCIAGTQAEQELSKAAKSPGDRPRPSYEL